MPSSLIVARGNECVDGGKISPTLNPALIRLSEHRTPAASVGVPSTRTTLSRCAKSRCRAMVSKVTDLE